MVSFYSILFHHGCRERFPIVLLAGGLIASTLPKLCLHDERALLSLLTIRALAIAHLMWDGAMLYVGEKAETLAGISH